MEIARYRLYWVIGGFTSDLLQIADPTVIAAKPPFEFTPYASSARGIVVLPCNSSFGADEQTEST